MNKHCPRWITSRLGFLALSWVTAFVLPTVYAQVGAASVASGTRESTPPLRGAPSPARLLATESSCQPVYPGSPARQVQAQGTTHVRLAIDASGHVSQAEISGASGPTRENRLVDAAVRSAFAACPAMAARNAAGESVDSVIVVAYRWRLDSVPGKAGQSTLSADPLP